MVLVNRTFHPEAYVVLVVPRRPQAEPRPYLPPREAGTIVKVLPVRATLTSPLKFEPF